MLVWGIAFFFVAVVIFTCGAMSLVPAFRREYATEMVIDLTIGLALCAGITCIPVSFGIHCLRAHFGFRKRALDDIGPAITIFIVLSAVGTIVTLAFVALTLAFLFSNGAALAPIAWCGIFFAGLLLLTTLAGWTRRTLSKARDALQNNEPGANHDR